MKSLVSLAVWCLLVVNLDATNTVMPEGKKLLYSYKVIATTELSADNIQSSNIVMKIKATIHTPNNNKAVVQFHDVQVAKANEEVRKLEVESSKWKFQTAGDYERKLSIPFVVNFQNGEVTEIEFPREDSEWSREFKRGFIETFQFQHDPHQHQQRQYSSPIHQNVVRGGSSGRNFYKVMEPCLSGICETQYIVNQFPDPGTGEKNVLNVTKMRDYSKCEDKTYFVHSSLPAYSCSDCEADISHPISKNTIVQMDLVDLGDTYLLEGAESISIIKVSPFGEDADQFITTVNKTITLMEVHSEGSQAPQVRTDRKETLVSTLTDKIERNMTERNSDPKEPISFPHTPSELCQPDKIHVLVTDIAETINLDAPKTKVRDSLSHIIFAVKALRECHYDDLDHLTGFYYEKFDAESPKRKVFLDLLAQSGTYPALLIWKKYTLSGKMKPSRIAAFLQTYSTHVIFPRAETVETVLKVLPDLRSQPDPQVFTTAAMQTGVLISRACLRYKPYWKSPVDADQRCPNPSQYVDELAHLLEAVNEPAKKLALVHALGETRLPEAIKYLVVYAKGDEIDCDILQTEAIFSLGKIAKLYPSKVTDLLYSTFYDLTNPTKARIASFISLVNTELNRHQLEKLAMFTWQETDTTVGTFVVNYIEDIANSTHSCYSELAEHAAHALNLANDEFDDNEPVVLTSIFDNEIDELGITSLLTTHLVSDDYPLAPEMLYMGLRPEVAGFTPDVLKIAGVSQGIKSMLDQLWGPVANFENHHKSAHEILEKVDKPNKQLGRNDIAQKLGLKYREEDDTKILIKVSLFSTQHRLVYLDKNRLVKLAQQFSENSRHNELRFQTVMMPLDLTVMIPTSIGLPFAYYARTPLILSLKVKYNAQGGSPSDFSGIKLDFDVKLLAATKFVQAAGVKLPAENKIVGAAYSTMVLFKPAVAGAISTSENGVSLELRPSSINPARDNTLAYFSTRPMTFIYNLVSLKPLSQAATPITYLDEPREYEYPIGGSLHNAPLKIKAKSDTFWDGRATLWDLADRYLDPSAILFAPLTQSWKNRVFELEWTESARNPEVDLRVEWTYRPSEAQPQKKLVSGVRGILPILMGWAMPPTKCDRPESGSSSMYSGSSSWESRDFKRPSKYDRSYQQQWKSRRDEDSREDVSDAWNNRYAQRFETFGSKQRFYQSSEESDEDDRHATYSPLYSGSKYSRKHDSMAGDWDSSRHSQMYGNDEYKYSSSGHAGADLRVAEIGKGVSELAVNAKLRVKAVEENVFDVKLSLKRNREQSTRFWDMDIRIPTAHQYREVCVKGRLHVPRVPCYYGDQIPIREMMHKEIESELLIEWGPQCSSPSGFYKAKIVAKKSMQQKINDPQPEDLDRKPWFCAQCERDQKKRQPYSDPCISALEFYSELHNVTAHIKYQNLPNIIKNLTMANKLAFLYTYYPHLSFDPVDVNNPEKEVVIKALYHYNNPAVDIKVEAPTFEAHFYKIPYFDSYLIPDPPNIMESVGKRIADAITDDSSYGMGVISGPEVNTFDNQSYAYEDWSGCHHVVTMDCTESQMFAILARPQDHKNKSLIVRVLNNEIMINPLSYGSGEIVINGQEQRLDQYKRVFVYDKEHQKTVAYVEKHRVKYIVTLPSLGVQVRTNGHDIVVMLSQIWKNKVCGILGDYDGDFIYEFKGPKECAYENGEDMARSYAIRDGSCSIREPPRPKLCDLDEITSGTSGYDGGENRGRSGVARDWSSSSDSYGCYMEKTPMVSQADKRCFAKQPVTKCRPGCTKEGEKTETVHFTCLDRQDPKADKYSRDIDRDRPVYGLESKMTHFSKQVPVPERCTSSSHRDSRF